MARHGNCILVLEFVIDAIEIYDTPRFAKCLRSRNTETFGAIISIVFKFISFERISFYFLYGDSQVTIVRL